MGRSFVLLLLIVAACGGAQVPTHNGYKGKKPQPWKKAKALKFDDKGEAKAEGELSYPNYKRAAWFAADLSQGGQLDVKLEITPPGDSVNDEFDLGLEVLDKDFRVIARSDLSEGDDTGDLQKSKSLKDLEPGKYYIHLYLQHRLDTADYSLRATFQPMANVGKSDFPAKVAFVPTLPMVPLQDDTPRDQLPKATQAKGKTKTTTTTTVKKEDPKPAGELKASIVGVNVVSGGTKITISRGTSTPGVAVGTKGRVVGLSNGAFELGSCDDKSCTATVPVTPDQLKGAASVVLTP